MGKKSDFRIKDKEKKFRDWFSGDHVLVHLDSRKDGVVVPEYLMNNPSLTLKLSYQFQGATNIDSEKIVSYLRFGGNYFECVIPWTAVWGMTAASGENAIWPEDLSQELLVQLASSRLKDIGSRVLGKKAKEGEDQESGKHAPAESADAPKAAPKKALAAAPAGGKSVEKDADTKKKGKVHPFLRRVK